MMGRRQASDPGNRSASRVATLAMAALLVCAGLVGCKKETPPSTRWEPAASAAKAADAPADKPAATAEKQAAGALNRFFPADGTDGYARVFTDESKLGTSIAKLTKDGKDAATLSISDANGDDAARRKFAAPDLEKVAGFPVVKVGNNQSALLVKNRYQVKVSSPTLDHEARKTWLGKFDLAGLAAAP